MDPLPGRSTFKFLLVAFGYFLLTQASFSFAELQANTSPVWPAAGLAMAVLFFGGRRYALAIFLASAASNLLTLRGAADAGLHPSFLLCSLGIALGNAAEGIVASTMLENRAGGRRFCLDSLGAARFVTDVCLLPPLLSAGCGCASLALTGHLRSGAGLLVFLTWYVGNVTGLLIFGAAAVLPWRESVGGSPLTAGRGREALGLFVALFIVGNAMTGFYLGPLLAHWPREYMILPVIVWAVFRFQELGTALSLGLVSLLGIGGTALGHQVSASTEPGRSLLYLQIFLAIVAGMAWMVCGNVNELRRLNARLEDIVTDRLLAERHVLREREEDVAVAAHDVRVPLVGIRNLLQLFLKHHVASDDSRARDLLGQAVEATGQALAVAARHLESDRVERLQPQPEPTDWVRLVAGVAERIGLAGTPHPVEIRFHSPLAALPGVVDRARALQVLENLAANAARFSPPGGVVGIGLRTEGETVVITVADQGPGIRKSEQPFLFRNVGFGGRARAKGSASGLGLYIVGKLVRELGGVIACESRRGMGTEFTLRLPVGGAAG